MVRFHAALDEKIAQKFRKNAALHRDHTFKVLLPALRRAHLLKPIVTLILRGSQRGLELNIRELRMQICQDFANTFLGNVQGIQRDGQVRTRNISPEVCNHPPQALRDYAETSALKWPSYALFWLSWRLRLQDLSLGSAFSWISSELRRKSCAACRCSRAFSRTSSWSWRCSCATLSATDSCQRIGSGGQIAGQDYARSRKFFD